MLRPADISASRLKIRIALVLFALVLVMTGLVSSLSMALAKRSMKKMAGEQQFRMLARAADEIDHEFRGRQADLQAFAAAIPGRHFHDGAWLQHYLRQHAAGLKERFDSLSIYDSRGKMLAALPQLPAAHQQLSLNTERLIDEALRLQTMAIAAPEPDTDAHHAAISFALPLSDAQSGNQLVLIGDADVERDDCLGRIDSMAPGRHGYAYIMSDVGYVIARSGGVSALRNVTGHESGSTGLHRALAGFEGTLQERGISGSTELQSFKRLKSAGWIIGAASPEEEAFADVTEIERKVWGIAILLAAIAGMLAWQVLRRQFLPLRQLRDRVQAMRDYPAQFVSLGEYPKNEIGDLAQTFERLMRERLLAEKNYRATESELRAAADSSLDAFFIFHPDRDDLGCIVDFRFWYLNQNAERLIGKTHQQAQDKRLCDLVPAIRERGLFDRMVEVIDDRRPAQEEFCIDSARAGVTWLHGQAVPIEDGIAISVRDISERKKNEFELRSSRAFLQSLIDHLPVLVFAKSLRKETYDQLVVWNKAAEEIMGYPASAVIGKRNHEIFEPAVIETLNDLDRRMLGNPEVMTLREFPYRHPDDTLRYLRLISVPLLGDDGRLDYILGIVEDITLSRQHELGLRMQQAELAAVTDASPLGIFRTDAEGAYTYVNRTYERLSELTVHAAMNDGWMHSLHPDDRERVCEEWRQAVNDRVAYHDTHRFLHADGSVVRVSVKAAPIVVDGCITGFAGSVDDITARFDTEHRLRMISEHLPVLIAYVDAERRYRFCNGNYERLFGASSGGLIGRHVRDVIGESAYAISSDKMAAVLSGVRVSFERQLTEETGARYWRVDYVPDIAEEGDVSGFYVMVLDITELKLVESRLRAIARQDSLTGLANRAHFEERLAEAITRSQRSGQGIGLMFLDIDRFKAINDTFGHHGGDEVLRQFAQRLLAVVRQTDMVARLAGDEFVIVLEALQLPDEVEGIAQKIIACMEPDFSLADGMRRVTTSIGITLRRSEESDTEAMLRRADEALYIAKSAGRNTYRLMY